MNFSVLSQEEIEALLKDSKETSSRPQDPIRDEVTGLYNLAFFSEEFRRVQARLARSKISCTLGVIRVDGIPGMSGKKEINARLFWAKLGKLLKNATRERGDDLLATIEPGLFVMLIPQACTHAILILERILYSIETMPWNDWGGIESADFLVSLTEVFPDEELDPMLARVSKGIHWVALVRNSRWHWERSSGQVCMHLEAPSPKKN